MTFLIRIDKIKNMTENLTEKEDLAEDVKPADVGSNSLGSIIQDFARSLDALREFVDLIEPFLKERVKEVGKKHRTGLLPLMVALNKLEPHKVTQAESSREDFLENKVKELFGENLTINVKGTGAKGTIDIKVTGTAASKVEQAIKAFHKAARHPTLLHRSSLISLVSIGESFLSQILHHYFDKFPGAIGATEKFFSLEQLKSFNSIDDAKICLIDAKVEEIMRDSFEDYIKFLRERIKLSLGYLDKCIPQLIEIYQRRNILVHNGGRVNVTCPQYFGPV